MVGCLATGKAANPQPEVKYGEVLIADVHRNWWVYDMGSATLAYVMEQFFEREKMNLTQITQILRPFRRPHIYSLNFKEDPNYVPLNLKDD
jgi:hypothetical protein